MSTDTNTTIQLISNILSKSPEARTEEENQTLVGILEEINYFKVHINDPIERREALRIMSRVFEYKYYARGSSLCHQGDIDNNFGIILGGRAFVFAAKTKEELDSCTYNINKEECFELYKQYIKQHNTKKKPKRLRAMYDPVPQKTILKKKETVDNLALESNLLEEPAKQTNYFEEIFRPENTIIPQSKRKHDFSFEEKLLLIGGGGEKNYFKNFKFTHKKKRELRAGDAIGEINLTLRTPNESTIIASEDLYLLAVKKEYVLELFQLDIPCFKKKRKLLSLAFPNLPYEMVVNLSAYVEEKIFSNWEYIYQEGDKAEAFYIIKAGKVQIIKSDNDVKVETSTDTLSSKDKQKEKFRPKAKLIVESVEVGGVFGEEEIIKKINRRYSAKCNGPVTSLYVLRNDVYIEIIQKYFPLIAQAFKSLMTTKLTWQKERVEKGKRIVTEISRNDEVNKPEIKENLLQTEEVVPKEFSRKRHFIANLHQSEERLSKITKSQINVTKPQESSSRPVSKVKPIDSQLKGLNTDIKPNSRNSLLVCSANDIEKIKSKLFERCQGKKFRNRTGALVYLSSDKKLETKQNTRPSSTKNVKAKHIKLPSKPSDCLEAKKKENNSYKSQVPSINFDKLFDDNSHNPKISARTQNSVRLTSNRQGRPTLSPSPFNEEPTKVYISSQFGFFTPKSRCGVNQSPFGLPNTQEHGILSTSRIRPFHYTGPDKTPKGYTLNYIRNHEPIPSFEDFSGLVQEKSIKFQADNEQLSNRSIEDNSHIFMLNRGKSDPKISVIRNPFSKQEGNNRDYNVTRKISAKLELIGSYGWSRKSSCQNLDNR